MKPENQRIMERSYLGSKVLSVLYLNKEISRTNVHNFRNIKIYLGHLDKYLTFY